MEREEAIEKVRQMSLPKETMEILEALAPELKESEDERIRKALIFAVRDWDYVDGIESKKVLAWLEKQKESLHISETCKENPDSFTDEDEKIRKVMLEHFKSKTKETWCGLHVVDIISYLEKQKDKMTAEEFESSELFQLKLKTKYANGYQDGLAQKEQKPLSPDEKMNHPLYLEGFDVGREVGKVEAEQKPAEWSEEDERISRTILNLLCSQVTYVTGQGTTSGKQFPTYAKERDWFEKRFKSLRPQPHCNTYYDIIHNILDSLKGIDFTQITPEHRVSLLNDIRVKCKNADECAAILDEPSWKPSEEQMEALSEAVSTFDGYEDYDAIKSLYNDLKKLM